MRAPAARLSTAAWAERALWVLRGSRMAGSERMSRESLAMAIHFPLLVFDSGLNDVIDLVALEDPELARMVRLPGSRRSAHGQHPGCTTAEMERRTS